MLIASSIFVITLVFVIWQPWHLSIGWTAIIGAIVALLFGIVDFADVITVFGLTWNATLSFVAIIIISLILDEVGLFEWAALHMARFAKGSGVKLFIYISLLGAVVAALFANDGAALILTPIVLAMVRHLSFNEKMIFPFVIASGFIADTTSLPFIVSNLVNIVSADFFGIVFLEYATRMVIPNMFAILTTIGILYWYFRKAIPKTFSIEQVKKPSSVIQDDQLFTWSWFLLLILILGYFTSDTLQVPVSFIAGVIALLFVMLSSRTAINTMAVVKNAPWNIVFFSLGMYVIVFGLGEAGLTHYVAQVIALFIAQGLLITTVGMGFLAAGLSSVMNNMPTVMINALAIAETNSSGLTQDALIYANIIGSDLGPKFTPIGSLATLVWLHVLQQKGVYISWSTYIKTGFLLTIPILFMTLLGLYLSFLLY